MDVACGSLLVDPSQPCLVHTDSDADSTYNTQLAIIDAGSHQINDIRRSFSNTCKSTVSLVFIPRPLVDKGQVLRYDSTILKLINPSSHKRLAFCLRHKYKSLLSQSSATNPYPLSRNLTSGPRHRTQSSPYAPGDSTVKA